MQNSLGSLSYARVLANATSTLILALGIIAALDQLQIAQNVVNAVLYAALAAVVGVVVVAVGGGGIAPDASALGEGPGQGGVRGAGGAPRGADHRQPGDAVRDEAQRYTN